MKGAHIVKHSVSIAGHQTSISLEEIFWDALKDIAARRNMPMRVLIAEIDTQREEQNLSSAIRVFVLKDALEFGAFKWAPVKRIKPSGS